MCRWAWGLMQGICGTIRGGLSGVVLVKEGWGWLGGRGGIRGAGICLSLCSWQKCRLCLPT